MMRLPFKYYRALLLPFVVCLAFLLNACSGNIETAQEVEKQAHIVIDQQHGDSEVDDFAELFSQPALDIAPQVGRSRDPVQQNDCRRTRVLGSGLNEVDSLASDRQPVARKGLGGGIVRRQLALP